LHGFAKSFEDKAKEVYVLFNNLTMFDDALRFRRYIECGSFPSLTKAMGIESAREVMQVIRFPATRSAILKVVGWKLIELGNDRQVKVDQLLRETPSKVYNNIDEVLQELKLD